MGTVKSAAISATNSPVEAGGIPVAHRWGRGRGRGPPHSTPPAMRVTSLDLLPNPDAAVVVVVAAGPKPNAAVDAVGLAPNEPKENPDVPSHEHKRVR